MALKGGTLFFLLTVTCAALALKPGKVPGKNENFKNMARKLMRECQNKGYPGPGKALLQTVFEESDVPSKDKEVDKSKRPLSSFLNVLNSVVPSEGSLGQGPQDDMDEMNNEMMDRTDLSNIIKRMKNSPEASDCYTEAFVAPLSWETLAENGENNMDPEEYDTFLTAAKPVVLYMPVSGVNFPDKLKGENMKKWMMMLKEVHGRMSKEKRAKVLKWAKEQIARNYFSCTTMPQSDPESKQLERCDPSLKWLDSDALEALGPFLADLKAGDVDSSPKERLCEFFSSVKLKAALRLDKMKPSLAKKYVQRVKECYPDEKRFEEQVEKLGELACYYNPSQKLTPDLSKKLLSQLEQCDDEDNGQIKKLKRNLINTLLTKGEISQVLQEPGVSITSFSAKQLSMVPPAELIKALKKLGPNVKWTPRQLKTLVKKILGDRKCKEITSEELANLGLVAVGLPRCVLKHVRSKLLNNTEGLKTVSKGMRKGQLKTVLRQLRKNVDPSELLEKLPEPLLSRVPLKVLEKVNISLEQLKNKTWSKAQASLLVKKLFKKKNFNFRRLRSLLQGITCKMIESASAKDLNDMAQDTAETGKWLPKVLAGCAARKLFSSLEKTQPDYFKTITEEELEEIPTALLLHLAPKKVEDLPDSVCPVLLDKMENADLSSLPLRGPSRLVLTKRALLCLTNGPDLSVLTIEDVARLGLFLCEVSPLQMPLMKPEVLTYSLEEMASRCKHIPRRHRAALIQLVFKTYGNVSEWSEETMEDLGPLIVLDDNVVSILPRRPWMAAVLYFLKSRLPSVSTTLEKKIFDLSVDTTLNTERRKRTVKNGSTMNARIPTADQIEKLNSMNVFWTKAELDQISNETFIDTVETLGSIHNYSEEQLEVLSKKAAKAFGPVTQMDEDKVTQLGCISQGFSNEDLQKLPFSLDTLEDIAPCGWKESQMESVWRAAAKYNNLTAEQLGDAEMASLNRFICGLNSDEMKQINKDAFKEAVDSMNDLKCSFKSTQQLTKLAVSVFGPPKNWTETQVSILGNLVAGLDSADLASLDPSVLSFLSTSSIQLMPPKNFAEFSTDQLMALGPDNAAVVTSDQRDALRGDQLSAVDDAMAGTGPRTGADDQTTKPPWSGAPSLTVEGILSVVKPLLFLLMGFLLL